MRRRPDKRCQFQPRDNEILLFIWRWKVASTAQIWLRFFANATKKVAYRRLKVFEDMGLIETVPFRRYGGCGWVLTKHGFNEIQGFIDGLASDFYLSEFPEHDFMAGVLHQGDWLLGVPEDFQIVTEQEVRATSSEALPRWTPVDRLHRPDGFTARRTSDGWDITAIEMELSMKSSTRYLDSSSYYYCRKEIGRILWCVSALGNIESIRDSHSGLDEEFHTRHGFVLVSAFRSLGWGAVLVAGDSKGQTIRQFLAGGNQREMLDESRGRFPNLHLFDTLKSYRRSAT